MRTVRIIGLALVIAGAVAATSHANAFGAIAVGGNDQQSPYGTAFSISYYYPTKETAEAKALAGCEDLRKGNGAACTIVGNYSHEWASVAFDPLSGTPGIGWAIGADKQSAERDAINRCRDVSSEDRKSFCVTSQTFHDVPHGGVSTPSSNK